MIFIKIKNKTIELFVNVFNRPIVITDKNGNKFWQYPRDSIAFNLSRKSVTDSRSVINYIKKNDFYENPCIDIGSHIGGVTVNLWSKIKPGGYVISVDADPTNYKKIKANLKLNNYPNKYVESLAISDKVGSTFLTCFPKSTGWQTLGRPIYVEKYPSFKIKVQTQKFSYLVKKYSLKKIDLVKIDTEGSEMMILNGMKKFLKSKIISKVIFEVNSIMLEGMRLTQKDLLVFWEDLDYQLYEIGANGNVRSISKDFNSKKKVWDCLATLSRK